MNITNVDKHEKSGNLSHVSLGTFFLFTKYFDQIVEALQLFSCVNMDVLSHVMWLSDCSHVICNLPQIKHANRKLLNHYYSKHEDQSVWSRAKIQEGVH